MGMLSLSARFFAVIFLSGLIATSVFAKPSLEDFLRERDLRNVVISPDGKHLAKIWDKDGTRIVTVSDLSQPDASVVGMLADKIYQPYAVSWASNSRLLVSTLIPYDTKKVTRDAERKKDFNIDDYFMFSRTFAMDVDAKNMVMLMENEKGTKRTVNLSSINHFLPDDPNHVLMPAYRKNIYTLYKVNVNTGASQLLMRGSRFTYLFISDESGKPRYRFDYRAIAKEIRIFEVVDNENVKEIDRIHLDQEETQDGFEPGELLGIYKDDLVYRKKNEVTGRLELIKYRSKDEKYEVLVSLPDQDILYPVSDSRSDTIVGYVVDGDYLRYRFFDPERQSHYDKLAQQVGNYNFYFSSYTRDGKKSIVHVYGQDDPLSYHLYDAETNQLTFIQNAYFNTSTRNLSLPALSTYLTRDQVSIRNYILFPADYQEGKQYPLIVMPHGGPHSRDRASYDDFAQFMSTRGYIVIKPNFRGSTGYGKAFEEAGYKQWGQLMQDDLTDAVDFMVRRGYVDAKKVCIVGISFGGYAALMGAVKTPDLYRCAISINGVTHLREQIKFDEKSLEKEDFIEKYVYRRIGHPVEDKTMLDANSPALHVNKINIPLLIIAGTDDKIVPYTQSKMLVKALKKYKKQHELIALKDTGHNPFAYRDDTEKVYREVEKFLSKHL